MEILQAIILGIVQGLTEFLPISSSGHLVLAQKILGFRESGLIFEVFVHFGTVLSVIAVFYRDILRILYALASGILHPGRWKTLWVDDVDFRMSGLILVGILPAGFFGLLLESQVSRAFQSSLLVGVMLIVTGFILWSSHYARQHTERITMWQSLLVGLAQALAIIPGISRSGTTITAGLWLKIKPEIAAKFSFFLAIPVILGASVMKFGAILGGTISRTQIWGVVSGTAAAFISGLIAIIFLLRVLRQGKFSWFALYCIGIGVLTVLLHFG